jgi:hypothetical protein
MDKEQDLEKAALVCLQTFSIAQFGLVCALPLHRSRLTRSFQSPNGSYPALFEGLSGRKLVFWQQKSVTKLQSRGKRISRMGACSKLHHNQFTHFYSRRHQSFTWRHVPC